MSEPNDTAFLRSNLVSPPRVMLSYRREDTAAIAEHLYRFLAERLGEENVFFDLDRISPGADWMAAIEQALDQCDVLLALIGPRWLTATNAEGRRRLDDEKDVVRREIETALGRNDVRVIPVCVGKTFLPKAEDLPVSLGGLRRRQALVVDETLGDDIGRVLAAVLDAELRWPDTLPRPLSSFLGRTRELVELGRLLLRDDVRLVTLSGPGGAGKTRLALEVAARVAHRHADGVHFVDLSAVEDRNRIRPAVADALNTTLEPIEAIGGGELLLVLDNLEQISDAGRELTTMLDSCSGLKVLTTSRSPLAVRAEHVFDVPPLDVEEAIRLFERRAQERGIEITTGATVRAICAELDCLPLAVELAAARAQLYTLDELMQRLTERLPVLSGGPRDAPSRQRTITATLDWSHSLLTPTEQKLFRSLGVFVGGFTLDAVETVTDGDPDTLAALVNASLVRRREVGTGSRFQMLNVIHEYASGLFSGTSDEHAIRARHAAYFATFSERARTEINVDPDAWVQSLRLETPNLRAAITWATENDPEGALLAIVGRLARYWGRLGLSNEARGWAEIAIKAAAGRSSPDVARCLNALGIAALFQGDKPRAHDAFKAGAAMWQVLGDDAELSKQLSNLGTVALENGDTREAARLFEEAVSAAQRANDGREELAALGNLGVVFDRTGETARSHRVFEEVVAKAEALGDDDNRGWALSNMGLNALRRGDFDQAERALSEALVTLERLGWVEGIVYTLTGLSRVAVAQHDGAQAALLLSAAERLGASLGLHYQGDERARHDETFRVLQALLGDEFDAEWARASKIEPLSIIEAETHRGAGADKPLP